uniref:Uncharacterized protein n=1 Tax=Lygus hesperus TaxID=30085 RepID=A0A0K8SXT7_LYGHE
MEKHWSHETPSGNGIPFREVGHYDEPIPETTRSLQRRESSLASSRLESAIDWTLEDWANRIKNIGGDVPIDKFAEMLFDGPALNDSSAAVKRGNTTFEPLGYSIIDRDERSYRARNRNGNHITSEGLEPSSVSWRLSPEDISLYRSRVLDDSTNKRLYVSSTNNQECTKSAERSLMSRTTDLMDRIKNFPSDVSGCDMADMLLPPPDGKSTKERLAKDSSDFSDVPNISTITDLLKAGLSSEELITKLLDGVKSPDNKGRRSSSVPGSRDGCVSPSRIPRPISPKLKQGASLSQNENMPSMKKATEKEPDITDSSGFEEPFVPMSYSIIDQDEESILKKYQLANDITIIGVENSNISWQLSSSDISLFREDGKSTSFERFPRTEYQRKIRPDIHLPPHCGSSKRSSRDHSHKMHQ